jgi:hypothetical protein
MEKKKLNKNPLAIRIKAKAGGIGFFGQTVLGLPYPTFYNKIRKKGFNCLEIDKLCAALDCKYEDLYKPLIGSSQLPEGESK